MLLSFNSKANISPGSDLPSEMVLGKHLLLSNPAATFPVHHLPGRAVVRTDSFPNQVHLLSLEMHSARDHIKDPEESSVKSAICPCLIRCLQIYLAMEIFICEIPFNVHLV